MPASPLLRRSSNKAAALIIVLAFVVLLTGLSLAYFSSTTTDRQLAHSSYNDTSSDLLARSALDIVIGDLKQEIVDGSNSQVIDGTTIYIPKTATLTQRYIVPQRSGHPNPIPADETTDPIPNLIRRSIRSDPIVAPGVASRASAVNSTTDASANGRSVNLARWNTHYLLPKARTDNDDSYPQSPLLAPFNPYPPVANGFTPPDWVIVTRAGPIRFDSWNSTLADPTNNNYALGRYAYAVYDEGGLLDMNVAGYPTSTGAIPSVTDIGRKGVLAFADLTALPIDVTADTFMSRAAINKFMLLRNYATMASTSSFSDFPPSDPNFTPFTPFQAAAFVNYYLGGSTQTTQIGTSQDFGQVNGVSSNASGAPRTDQSFINRAELINFVKSTDIPFTGIVNTLQYLGTFSREQNKPTFPLIPAGIPGVVATWLWGDSNRRVLPQRFYLGNLNEVVSSGDATKLRQHFGLQFASVGNPGPGACDNQVRWKYVGQSDNTPLQVIPPFPSDLTTLDFFQYINYALFGVTAAETNLTHVASTLQIGASIIDLYDADGQSTGIYFGLSSATCDLSPAINACLVYGLEQNGSYVLPTCISPPAPTLTNVSVNRPLHSVGEFSYAYNLNNAISGNNGPTYYLNNFKEVYETTNPDPALLDFFTYNKASVRSGIVSLNTRQPPVLAALLKGAIYRNSDSSVVNNPDATTAANSIVKANYAAAVALSRADIANLSKAAVTAVNNPPFTNDDPPAGTRTSEARETIARALSEVVQTRTWGLLIDLVAQTGHYAPNASGLAQFVVEGEKRYWLHVAIDRFDGTIVGQQLEEVIE